MLQNATPLRKSAPGPPNNSDEHVSCIAPATENASFADPLQMSHACHRFWKCHKTLTFCSHLTRCTIPCACHAKRRFNVQQWSEHVVFLTFLLPDVLRATTACTFSTAQLLKVLWSWGVLYILTSKCASHHNGVHFFATSTSKSGPNQVCFVHVDFEMCFAPQRRALFRHLNFQKWSEPGVFCTFWLRNVLRTTMACTSSAAQLPKVVRTWCALYILTWKRASRHNGVHFFISQLASWLRTLALASLLFDPPEATNHWKNTVFRDFPTFSWTWIFFLLRLSLSYSLLFSDSSHLCFSSLSILSEVWFLNFLRWLYIYIYNA